MWGEREQDEEAFETIAQPIPDDAVRTQHLVLVVVGPALQTQAVAE